MQAITVKFSNSEINRIQKMVEDRTKYLKELDPYDEHILVTNSSIIRRAINEYYDRHYN